MIDFIFTAGAIVLIVGLLPAVFDSETRIPLRTSLPTAIVLFVYSCTFAWMGLRFSAASSVITAALWAYLALDKRDHP